MAAPTTPQITPMAILTEVDRPTSATGDGATDEGGGAWGGIVAKGVEEDGEVVGEVEEGVETVGGAPGATGAGAVGVHEGVGVGDGEGETGVPGGTGAMGAGVEPVGVGVGDGVKPPPKSTAMGDPDALVQVQLTVVLEV